LVYTDACCMPDRGQTIKKIACLDHMINLCLSLNHLLFVFAICKQKENVAGVSLNVLTSLHWLQERERGRRFGGGYSFSDRRWMIDSPEDNVVEEVLVANGEYWNGVYWFC
jgi:hypothetical protein